MKTAERKSIVEKRWQARHVFDTAINAMPETITVYNRGGERDRREESLDETLENLEAIKRLVFNRNTNQHFLAISCDDPTRISYARDTDHKFSSKRRVKTTWQKYIIRHFPDREFHAKALDLFVSKFQSEVLTELDFFKEVTGQELLRYFERHWGGSSCMTGEDSQDHIQIYAKNKDIVSLLVYHDPDGCPAQGRALLWTLGDGKRFMDRVYPNDGSHIEKFYVYAAKKGIEIRGWHGYPDEAPEEDDTYPYVPVGADGDKDFSVTLIQTGSMPYMDSFHYGYFNNDLVHCFTRSDDSCNRVFSCTGGGTNEFPRWSCDCCGTPITESSADHSNGYCHSCNAEHGEFTCVCCESECMLREQNDLTVYRIRWRPDGLSSNAPRVPTNLVRRMHMGSEVCASCYESVINARPCDCCGKHFDVDQEAPGRTFVEFSTNPVTRSLKSQFDIRKFVQRAWVADTFTPERIRELGSADLTWAHNFTNMCWFCWADKLEYYGFRLNHAGEIPRNTTICEDGTWLFSYDDEEEVHI